MSRQEGSKDSNLLNSTKHWLLHPQEEGKVVGSSLLVWMLKYFRDLKSVEQLLYSLAGFSSQILQKKAFFTLKHHIKRLTWLSKKKNSLGKTPHGGHFYSPRCRRVIILGLVFLHWNLFCGILEILNSGCSSGLPYEDIILNTTTLITLALVGRWKGFLSGGGGSWWCQYFPFNRQGIHRTLVMPFLGAGIQSPVKTKPQGQGPQFNITVDISICHLACASLHCN